MAEKLHHILFRRAVIPLHHILHHAGKNKRGNASHIRIVAVKLPLGEIGFCQLLNLLDEVFFISLVQLRDFHNVSFYQSERWNRIRLFQ